MFKMLIIWNGLNLNKPTSWSSRIAQMKKNILCVSAFVKLLTHQRRYYKVSFVSMQTEKFLHILDLWSNSRDTTLKMLKSYILNIYNLNYNQLHCLKSKNIFIAIKVNTFNLPSPFSSRMCTVSPITSGSVWLLYSSKLLNFEFSPISSFP